MGVPGKHYMGLYCSQCSLVSGAGNHSRCRPEFIYSDNSDLFCSGNEHCGPLFKGKESANFSLAVSIYSNICTTYFYWFDSRDGDIRYLGRFPKN